MAESTNIVIPNGIAFGNKVIEIPATLKNFDRPTYVQTEGSGRIHELYRDYIWINRGDNLAEYKFRMAKSNIPFIKLFAGKETHSIFLPSPVNGLLLSYYHHYGGGEGDRMSRTALLITDNEYAEEDGHYMFSSLCNFLWEHRRFLFLEYAQSEEGKNHHSFSFTEENIKKELEKQKQQKCQYVEVKPKYEKHIQDAVSRHPELRPYLKHLL